MKKRLFTLLILICMVLFTICSCESEKKITVDEAFTIMIEDLGENATGVSAPHIHEGTYEGKDCYNIYITANGESLVYVISTSGEILYKGNGSHSH